MNGDLILASASSRRAELLASAGYSFSVRTAEVDEALLRGEQAADYVLRVARDKAHVIAARWRRPGDLVLAADTTVVAGGEILGKPAGRDDAIRMLRLLSGAVHAVLTGVVVVGDGRELAEAVETRVHVAPLSEREIAWYVDSDEPDGKAGGYAIQGRAARFIERIEGSWSNVVGLPIATVHRLLAAFDGVPRD